jgi:hypothetical protein
MADRPLRPAQPRRWSALALAGAAAGLAAASPAPALTPAGALPAAHTPLAPLILVDSQGGEGGEAAAPVAPSLSAVAEGGEGGEGGEAGAVANLTGSVAYLDQLAIVEGHMRAAVMLYSKGQVDEAVALSYHPEAEMMDSVRASLTAHGAADITPAMTALSEAMEGRAAADVVTARLADVTAVIARAEALEADETKVRFDALVALVKAAAAEYAGAVADGKVTEPMGFHESYAFLQVAADRAAALAALPDARAAAAGARIGAVLQEATAAFGDMTAAEPEAGDPGALLAVEGRVELAASQVR